MTFEGFVSFLDPPKKDVKEVLKQLQSIGVETKIITGDNELVTKKICDEVELKIIGTLLGSDLDKLKDRNKCKIKTKQKTNPRSDRCYWVYLIDMKNLAPNITRQRLLIEGYYKINADKNTIKNYFEKITESLRALFLFLKKAVMPNFVKSEILPEQ